MMKTIAAVAAGVALVATQAMATTQSVAKVGDRIGAPTGASSELAGGVPAGVLFAGITIAAFAIFIAAADDDSESD